MKYRHFPTIFISCLATTYGFSEESSAISLLQDLALVEKINQKINDTPPFFYNFSMMGGYFTMPSARMNKTGMVSFGVGVPSPYNVYGLNIQPFDRLELSANYVVYRGVLEPGFGHEGFGDDADRTGNIKIGILTPAEDLPFFPLISIGAEDFIGTKRFNSQYVVATQTFADCRLECSLGWGHGRIKGFFGALAWSPLHHTKSFFKDLTFQAEYDAIDYKNNPHEHPSGRTVKTRVNVGLSLLAFDCLQLSLNSLRGCALAGSCSIRYPLGTTTGFFPKTKDPSYYKSPINTQPLNQSRPEEEFAHELAYALSDQGLDLYRAYLQIEGSSKVLYLTIVNNRYRDHFCVKERIQDTLAALTPSNIDKVAVTIEATALPCQSYTFLVRDLYRYRKKEIGYFELEALSPIKEAIKNPTEYDSILLFKRSQPIWTFTARPRLITFFGNTQGKLKASLSAVASPEGYLFDHYYYKTQVSYCALGNTQGMSGVDRLNPSHLFTVRSDSMKYFQPNTVHLEQAFIQRSWNLSKGFFYRLSAGYFETAYAGAATEILFYPVSSPLAVGLQCATVWKRKYEGIGFFHKVRKFDGTKVEYLPFTGVQCFLKLHYVYKPLQMDFTVTAGRFLAKDLGARFDVGRYFANGIRFGLWYSLTNANEKLNGHRYHDKGFSFLIPLDFFLKQSSRNYVGYAMAAWLRDQAAQADTGKPLYTILSEERFFP